MTGKKVQGEGDYESARKYNEATERFARSGRVPDAARAAAPRDEKEKQQLAQAEETGRVRAKDEDPTVTRVRKKPSGK